MKKKYHETFKASDGIKKKKESFSSRSRVLPGLLCSLSHKLLNKSSRRSVLLEIRQVWMLYVSQFLVQMWDQCVCALQGERGPPGPSGPQGVQGCSGLRGTKVQLWSLIELYLWLAIMHLQLLLARCWLCASVRVCLCLQGYRGLRGNRVSDSDLLECKRVN